MKIIAIILFVVALEIGLQELWIQKLQRWQAQFVQKAYGPQNHIVTKSSTPSMGGVVFIPVVLATIPLIAGTSPEEWRTLAMLWLFPFGAALIGFIDDWIKFRTRSSEGFASIYKLVAQILLVVPWSYWTSVYHGISLWPGIELPVWLAVPTIMFLSLGVLNAVNVTDGLDGLATGACILSLLGAILWLPFEAPIFYSVLAAIALCAAFLWHNAYPAKIFMGDTGSHFLAGMLVSFCVYGDCLIAIIPLGFLFGLEIASVAIQLIAIHRYKRKVFLMSPVHHHFELLGWSETQIVARFWIVHGIGLTVLATLIMWIFAE